VKHLKTIFFLIVCLTVGVGIGKAYLWWRNPRRGFEKHIEPPLITGIGDAPGNRGFTVRAGDLASLPAVIKQAQECFGTGIGLEYSPALTKDALINAAKAVHGAKMSVTLLPPAVFNVQNPYPRGLGEIAADAQAAGLDYVCISWLNAVPDEAYWSGQIQAVREAYHGQIILAGTDNVLPMVPFFSTIDVIGAIGPLHLARRLPNAPDDINVHDMRVMWDCSLTSLSSLAKVHDKKLALLHMNVPLEVWFKLPVAGTIEQPPKPNYGLQELLYEALLLETKGRAEWTDMMLFDWGTTAAQKDAPNHVPGLMAKITEAWDPKKPKQAETTPATPDAGDADTAAN
jgi:hypothetical protein